MEIGFKVPNDEGIKQDNNDDNSFIDETYDASKNKPVSSKALEVESLIGDQKIQGSESRLITYIIIFLLLAGVFISYLFLTNRIKTLEAKTAKLSSAINDTSPKTQNSFSDAKVVKIPSLGVELLTPNKYSDLTFVEGSTNVFSTQTKQAVFISSKTLTDVDSGCQASSTSVNGSSLGVIAKIPGTYPQKFVSNSGILLIQEQDDYIAYMPDSKNCSLSLSVQRLINNYRLNLKINPETVSLIQ